MYGRYTQELGVYAKEEAARLREDGHRRRSISERSPSLKVLEYEKGRCVKCRSESNHLHNPGAMLLHTTQHSNNINTSTTQHSLHHSSFSQSCYCNTWFITFHSSDIFDALFFWCCHVFAHQNRVTCSYYNVIRVTGLKWHIFILTLYRYFSYHDMCKVPLQK